MVSQSKNFSFLLLGFFVSLQKLAWQSVSRAFVGSIFLFSRGSFRGMKIHAKDEAFQGLPAGCLYNHLVFLKHPDE